MITRRFLSVLLNLIAAAVVLAAGTDAFPQDRPRATNQRDSGSLADAPRNLEAQIQELHSALLQVGAEVARSRAEARELQQELRETRHELTALKQQLEEGRHAQANPEAGGASASIGKTEAPSPPKSGQEDRLAKLEEDQQLLSAKVDDQYSTKVESASKYRVRLSGIALLNAFSNRGIVDNMDIPTFARPLGIGDTSGSFGATVRQSMIGLEVFGPVVGGAKTSADLQVDFFGGFPNAPDGVAAGVFRLRVARLGLNWPHTSIVGGQDAPFFSPLSPTSLASLAYPALSYAGNLWTWTPQVRVEHRVTVGEESSILLQGGILDALTGEPPYDPFYRLVHSGERGGQPAYATRIAWTHRSGSQSLTLGAGGYYARQNWGTGHFVDAWAATADWDIPLGRGVFFTGEFYRGRALGGLGGGSGRSVIFGTTMIPDPTAPIQGLNATGGWTQIKFRPFERVEFNGAFGQDFTSPSDLTRFPQSTSYFDPEIVRNSSFFVNSIYRPRSNLLLSLEYRRLRTAEIIPAIYTANQVNLSAGILF